MHQIIEDDPQAIHGGLYIEVESLYALGYRLDRPAFEAAGWRGIEESEETGEPVTLWPGAAEAIEEIGGDDERRRWLATRSLETLAGLLVAERLRETEAVRECCEAEFTPDEEPDLDFAIRCKFRLNQRSPGIGGELATCANQLRAQGFDVAMLDSEARPMTVRGAPAFQAIPNPRCALGIGVELDERLRGLVGAGFDVHKAWNDQAGDHWLIAANPA
ncbi:MAG: hypothetical protein ISN29_11455 [Gammaproteobacteria bacterium AqS3]|nr:hypothetical protein [Gammaproteobacteria bacterium AqS3]